MKKNQENHAGILQLNLKSQTGGRIHREKRKRDKKRETRTQGNAKKKIAREKRKCLNNLFFVPDGLR